MINIFGNDTNLVHIIPDYFYSKPVLTVYSIQNKEGLVPPREYKIEKRFHNINRLEIEKYINSVRQIRNDKEYYTSISIQISQELLSNLRVTRSVFENILEIIGINNESDDIELCLVSKIGGEVFSITPYFITNDGIEFFIYNSKREYEWYLGIMKGDKLIGISDKIQIGEKILEYFIELEMNL